MPCSRASACQALRWCGRLSTMTPSRSKRTARSARRPASVVTRDDDEPEAAVVAAVGVGVAAGAAGDLVAAAAVVAAAAARALHLEGAPLLALLVGERRAGHRDA